ncbi:hypothetical protein [Paenibacillus lutimineralis]|uniref:Uncharacterized protein n=1 Tax=Paenibacillus lutimineralis TaxID=2707005 RepID=A0A3S9V1J9_9BACL|nr:hypothetical protein [Paenibacillus lutimineralis]AZS16462.1 hypothetical protein EI981_19745 [Paenibacillus lutimineralis]
MIFFTIYMIVGMIVAAAGLASAARTVVKKKNYPVAAVFIVCILFSIVLSPIWPVMLGFTLVVPPFISMGDKLIEAGLMLTLCVTLPIVVVFILFWVGNRRRKKRLDKG